MYIDYKEVGKRIAARRKKLGLKQSEVTEKAGLSDKYLSNIERATSILSIDVLMKICKALETTPDYILLGTATEINDSDYQKYVCSKLGEMSEDKQKLALSLIDWLSVQ